MRLHLTLAFAFAVAAAPVSVCAAASSPHALFLAERAAVGGDAWNGVAGIRSRGSQTAGGVPGAFVQTIDHRSGFSRTELQSGPLLDVSGFDGTLWDARNGIVSQADLPGIVADGVTAAYMARDGWWSTTDLAEMELLPARELHGRVVDVVRVVPRGGSPVDVWLDHGAHLIVRTVQQTDGGDVTTDYADYRAVARVRVPFGMTSVDPTAARTETRVTAAEVLRAVPASEVARPAQQVRSSFAGTAPTVTVTDATAGAFASRAIAGNIGARVLERFRLTFDYRARTVTFVPNARAGERFSGDRIGWSLSQRAPDAFVVLSVVAASPAAAAGVRAGDEIVEIDGKNVAAQHLGAGDLSALVRDRTADLPLVIRRGTDRIATVIKPRELL